jgi:hypothetical protein
VIVDIDGTLALRTSRNPYDLTKVGADLPNHPIVELVRQLATSSDVYFVSGRDDSCRDDTQIWLDQHVRVAGSLFLRSFGDARRDADVKLELYRRFIEPVANVWLVLDDRDQTVQMWRSIGLTCVQVAPGSF